MPAKCGAQRAACGAGSRHGASWRCGRCRRCIQRLRSDAWGAHASAMPTYGILLPAGLSTERSACSAPLLSSQIAHTEMWPRSFAGNSSSASISRRPLCTSCSALPHDGVSQCEKKCATKPNAVVNLKMLFVRQAVAIVSCSAILRMPFCLLRRHVVFKVMPHTLPTMEARARLREWTCLHHQAGMH